MKYIIDRFENEFAVCETDNNEMINIKKQLISEDAKEGDVLILVNSKYIVDKEETKKIKDKIKKDIEDLWI